MGAHRVCLLLLVLLGIDPILADDAIRITTDGRPKRDPVFLDSKGSELLYVLLEKPTQLRIMKLSAEKGTAQPLHDNEGRSEFEPAVSVDGRYLAFVQNRGNLSLALVIQDQALTQVGEVPPGGGFSGMHSPKFLPDGSRLLFSYPEGGRQQIYSVNLQGQDQKVVVDSEGINNWPDVASDGSKLIYSSSRSGNYEVYISDLNGGVAQRLTFSERQDLRPRFSPDGRRVAFTSNRDGNYEIYLMDSDGSNLQRLTDHPEQDDYPVWDPSGTSLIIVREQDGRTDLYRIAVPVRGAS